MTYMYPTLKDYYPKLEVFTKRNYIRWNKKTEAGLRTLWNLARHNSTQHLPLSDYLEIIQHFNLVPLLAENVYAAATLKTEASSKDTVSPLVLVSNDDDWEGLFLHGKKVISDHKISKKTISEYSAKYGKIEFRSCTDEYNEEVLQSVGDFPEDLSEISLEEP